MFTFIIILTLFVRKLGILLSRRQSRGSGVDLRAKSAVMLGAPKKET